MHSLRLLIAGFALLALATPAAAVPETGSRPSLRVSGTRPVVVSGVEFRRGENVRVSVVADQAREARMIRSDRAGRFRISFPQLVLERCGGEVAVLAIGSRGSRAAAKIPRRLCPLPGG